MAKILVADDNSNIQKMVGLALKDQGIDVVAVGNGEAAVRKISDIRPDLVLADVFMPVRNGYEVCQYVKMDPSLAHIPVILLVGAFDPLDEQEAQRVGADGVLKKPFVPPDPLISMVKSALQRAGVAHGIAAAKTAEQEALKASDLLTPSVTAVPTVPSVPFHVPSVETPITPLDQESFVDEEPARPQAVRIDSGSQPVAFGSLLETPSTEAEDDAAFLPPKDSELAADRVWGGKDAEETDEEEEEEESGSWRREEAESIADAAGGSAKKKWKSTGGFEPVLTAKPGVSAWEPEEEKTATLEAVPSASNSVTEAPPIPSTIPDAAPAISPMEANAWAPAVSPALQEKSSTETATAVEEVARKISREQSAVETAAATIPEVKQDETEKKASKESWFSVPANPWNAEMEKANRLASAWDSGAPVAAPSASSNGTEKAAEEETKKVIEEAALPAAAVEAIREEAAHVAEDVTHATGQVTEGEPAFYATEALVETPAAAPVATPSMDDLVAKVLARMSPEVLQAVTREILKPVVEAMVKEEMKLKNS